MSEAIVPLILLISGVVAMVAKIVIEDRKMNGTTWMPRRDFLARLTWGTTLSAMTASVAASVRMLFPKVIFEPPLEFTAGLPDEYRVGEVSERWKRRYRTWIVRTPEGFYAISAKCTHLGCTPNWMPLENKFKCPCHGSGFYMTGINFEGPAPRPLERFRIRIGADGQLIVDRSRAFRHESGQWNDPDSFATHA